MVTGRSGLLALGVAAASLTLSACSSTSSSGSGGTLLGGIFSSGAPAPSAPALPAEVPCPQVSVAPGGGAINSYSGGRAGAPEALRSQISIANVARECNGRPDGAIVVKVGVEGRVLVGVAGSAGRFEAPVRFAIKRGDRVVASATRRASVALAAGEIQGTFTVVEDGLVVPAGSDDFDIEVGLGGSGAAERPATRARR